MKYRKFGNTGVEISTLGFGCMRLKENELPDGTFEVDQEHTNAMLTRAYELGVNYFDTALYYCHKNSEIAVGKAVKPFRDKIYLSTKCPMEPVKSREDYRATLETSLEKLGTDYVDFYHFWSINQKVFDEKIIGLGLLIWAMANFAPGGVSLLSRCAGFLDPLGQLMGLDGMILLSFLLAFPAGEIFIPVLLMGYLSTGTLTDYEGLAQLQTILTEHGWTIKTAVCTLLFTLFHFPCSTTCLTVKKETGSFGWTLLAMVLPTAVGMLLCIAANLLFTVLT